MNRTVFVGDLSYYTNEVHLMQYMSTVGKVATVQILRGSCGESLLHGFVKFENDQGALRACQNLHNVKFMGRRLIVNSTNTKAPKKPYHLWHKFTLHFTTDIVLDVTEDDLERLCTPFGEIGDTVVRSYVPLNPPEVGMAGYAVVFYTDLTSAQRAYEFLHKTTINHLTFTCSFSATPQPVNAIPRRVQNPNAMLGHSGNAFHGNGQPGSHSRIQIHPSASASGTMHSTASTGLTSSNTDSKRYNYMYSRSASHHPTATNVGTANSLNTPSSFFHPMSSAQKATRTSPPTNDLSFNHTSGFSETPDHFFARYSQQQAQQQQREPLLSSQQQGQAFSTNNHLFYPQDAALFRRDYADTRATPSLFTNSNANKSVSVPLVSVPLAATKANNATTASWNSSILSPSSSSTGSQQTQTSLFAWTQSLSSTSSNSSTPLWDDNNKINHSNNETIERDNTMMTDLPISLSFMTDSAHSSGKHTHANTTSSTDNHQKKALFFSSFQQQQPQFEQLFAPTTDKRHYHHQHQHHSQQGALNSISTSSVSSIASSLDYQHEPDELFLETPMPNSLPTGFFFST